MKKTHVIIDTDGGIDDIAAIIYALYSPKIELEAIVLSYGNLTLKDTKKQIENLFNYLDFKLLDNRIPYLYLGEKYPLEKKSHKSSGIHKILPVKKIKSISPTIEKMDKLVSQVQPKSKLIYITLGPLTNLSKLSKSQEFLSKISELLIMGGTFFHPGNATPFSEANIFWDPKAANKVFNLKISKTLVPLNFTEQIPIKLKSNQHPMFSLFYDYQTFYTQHKKFYLNPTSLERKLISGAFYHDLTTVMLAEELSKVKTQKIKFSTKFLEYQGLLSPISNKLQEKYLKNFELKIVNQLPFQMAKYQDAFINEILFSLLK